MERDKEKEVRRAISLVRSFQQHDQAELAGGNMEQSKEQKVRQTVVHLAQQFLETGLVVRTWGNFSGRLDGDAFVVTPSGRAYEGMTAADLVKVSIEDGTPLDKDEGKPSSEAPMHAVVYRRFPSLKVAAHTHQVYASAISLLNTDIVVKGKWQSLLGTTCIPLSAYGLPGSKSLHRNMADTTAQSEARIILMSRHGAFVFAETTADCVRLAEDLERFAIEVYEERLGRPTEQRDDIHSDTEEEANITRALQATSRDTVAVSADSEVKPWLDRRLRPYVDDFAQICGTSVGRRRGSSNVVFDPNRGVAICYGKDPADALNVRAVLEKNARAANMAELVGTPPLPRWEALAMRLVYKLKYSKRAGR